MKRLRVKVLSCECCFLHFALTFCAVYLHIIACIVFLRRLWSSLSNVLCIWCQKNVSNHIYFFCTSTTKFTASKLALHLTGPVNLTCHPPHYNKKVCQRLKKLSSGLERFGTIFSSLLNTVTGSMIKCLYLWYIYLFQCCYVLWMVWDVGKKCNKRPAAIFVCWTALLTMSQIDILFQVCYFQFLLQWIFVCFEKCNF